MWHIVSSNMYVGYVSSYVMQTPLQVWTSKVISVVMLLMSLSSDYLYIVCCLEKLFHQ